MKLVSTQTQFAIVTIAMLLGFVALPSIRAESPPGKATATNGGRIELHPRLVRNNEVYGVEYLSAKELIGSVSSKAPAGVELRLPGELFKPLEFRTKKERGKKLELGPAKIGALTL
ncbi:MAG: hypothetical protein ABIR24_01160, partial [Verrucomicrobiota bacterium]